MSNDAVIRDNQGRFQPGSKSLGGRAPKTYEKGIVEAIKRKWSPDVIVDRLEEAYELALELRSPRAMLGIIELASAYGYGKPVITVTTAPNEKREELLRMIAEDDTPLLPGDNESLPVTSSKLLLLKQ